ncbi:hypothetical protein [Limnoglobus roseus]|uniref:Uncharacterized protein n=1 Tax=Limnoglobus roseus TaxID=2598579 RepID=A0A5C1A5K6_9BACT|nr:hypothetical protein [Limnoglobus roseus]QEL14429.1 hypothetical protein PX52LOC_01317 [Limnoglobus roseus]
MPNLRLPRAHCDRDDLPSICAKCGREETTLVSRTFTWCPSWVFIFIIFGGLLPLLIVYFIARKRMRVNVPLCDEHAGGWKRAALFGWTSVLGCVALLIVGLTVADQVGPIVAMVGGVGFVVCLIALAVWNMFLIRPTKITKEDITLAGVCQEFADEAKELRSRYDDDDDRRDAYGDYDDDRPQRRTTRTRDRYEDEYEDNRRDRD